MDATTQFYVWLEDDGRWWYRTRRRFGPAQEILTNHCGTRAKAIQSGRSAITRTLRNALPELIDHPFPELIPPQPESFSSAGHLKQV